VGELDRGLEQLLDVERGLDLDAGPRRAVAGAAGARRSRTR
jgi:hypothetical protein